jgi:hypothetical protein
MGAEASKGWKEVAENSEEPAARHAQLVRQSTPNKRARVDPEAPAGGLLTCVHDWPFQVSASPFAPLLPTAVQLVGLKQLMP